MRDLLPRFNGAELPKSDLSDYQQKHRKGQMPENEKSNWKAIFHGFREEDPGLD